MRALSEWFYSVIDPDFVQYFDGGDLLGITNKNYDHQKGTTHYFEDVMQLFGSMSQLEDHSLDPRLTVHFIKMLFYDAIIGNTDRHQNNWGIIKRRKDEKSFIFFLAPAFDNGTALGHEILPDNFLSFNRIETKEKYVNKGNHHLRWSVDRPKRIGHLEFFMKFKDNFPFFIKLLDEMLDFNFRELKSEICELSKFNIPVPFTDERSNFTINLLEYRISKFRQMIS